MKFKSWMVASGLAVCLLVQPAVAGQFEDGLAAYDRGDYTTALQLWRPLADQGCAHAQYNLGFIFDNGHGVPEDHAEAAKWYRLAADQGDATAQVKLGFMYDNGRSVPLDHAEAAKWYRLTADQGDATAQNNLGIAYAKGEGVPQDYVQAHMWFNLASAGYPASETIEQDNAVSKRDRIATLMTPDQIAEAQRLAREWLAAHPKP